MDAQLSVSPLQGLGFGSVVPGIVEVVSTADTARRAEFEVRGARKFTMELALPTEMVSPAGEVMPLSFLPTDGSITWLGFNRPPKAFDPSTPESFNLPTPSAGALIYLGGTVAPDPLQAPGTYSATVTVIISNTGN